MLSIPGLAHWIVVGVSGNSNEAQKVPAVVVIDSNTAHSQEMVGYKPADARYLNAAPQQKAPGAAEPEAKDSQLTVEEMDVALRYLIQRIETLEEANRNDVETGKRAVFPASDGANNL